MVEFFFVSAVNFFLSASNFLSFHLFFARLYVRMRLRARIYMGAFCPVCHKTQYVQADGGV